MPGTRWPIVEEGWRGAVANEVSATLKANSESRDPRGGGCVDSSIYVEPSLPRVLSSVEIDVP